MISSIEKLDGLKRRLLIHVPVEAVEEAFETRLKEVSKKVKMSGFRIGKVPKKVVEQRHGKGIFQELLPGLVEPEVRKAVEEHDLKVVGSFNAPHLIQASRGQALECSVDFEVYPRITLKLIQGEEITRCSAEIIEKDIDNMIKSLQAQHVEWLPVSRPAQAADRVTIDFEGRMDGVLFEEGSSKDFQFKLGSNQMLTDFEVGMTGMTPGETREISLTFPNDYLDKNCAGKDAVFKVTLNQIDEPRLPIIDDAFLKKMGIQSGDVQDFRIKVRDNMEKKVAEILKNNFKQAVLDKLLSQNSFEVPESLVNSEIQSLQNKSRYQMTIQMGISEKEASQIKLSDKSYKDQARKRVRLGILLGEVVKHYGIKIDQDAVQNQIEKIAATYREPEMIRDLIHKNKQVRLEIETTVLEDRSLKRLSEDLKIKDEVIPYQEALRQENQNEGTHE